MPVADITDTNNIVVISDTHIGCGIGLMAPGRHRMDTGQTIGPTPFQRKVWRLWRFFWDNWVPRATRGEPYVVVHCGDAMEGVHHGAISQWSQNDFVDYRRHARLILEPEARKATAYFHLRGTEAHAGPCGKNEEALAEDLHAIPDKEGHHARWELYKRIGSVNGRGGATIHFAHHIGIAGSQHYETSAPMKELIEAYVEAARWADAPLAGVARGHRHRGLQIRIPAEVPGLPDSLEALVLIVPGWQGKTPFTHRMAGGRVTQPQFGGGLISCHQGVLYATAFVKRMPRPHEA